ncbi:MAG: phosphoribosylformylglycinamidine cyclo-ligase [Phycisphaeraceae bacterium]|nr:phosphoribosylformylglycinamidine cyclo-ligase [Phycisphaeraceae bacterium]
MARKRLTYADAGVDIDAGEQVVDAIKPLMRRTYGPRVLGRHGGFAGCFRLDYNERLFKRNYRDPVLVSCTDGVGSKVLLAVKMRRLDTVGQDLVAMNVNDMLVQGAEPLFFLDYIGVHKVVPDQVAQIVKGVADGCRLSRCALLGGETAELPDLYRRGDFDLAGFAVGVCELRRMVDGSHCAAGDVILGLSSSGVHSNGYSLVRAIVRKARLDLRKRYTELGEDRSLGEILLTPTRIYTRAICAMLAAYRVKKPVRSMSHITGGGLPGNVMRTLGSHLNARIERGSWPVPPIFDFLARHGDVDDDQMQRVFNLGVGYICVVRPHFADAVAHRLEREGETVRVIGKVVRGTGRMIMN